MSPGGTVPGDHGPNLGEGVSTVFNVMIWLIHYDAQNPGAIDAAVGGGSSNSSRAIIEYMRKNMNSMGPRGQESLIGAIEANLGSASAQQ